MNKTVFEKHEHFFSQFKPCNYKKKEVLLRPDDNPSAVHYICEGYVESYAISSEGEQFTHMVYKRGDILPLESILETTSNDFYYEAITPVRAYKCPISELQGYVKDNPKILYDFTLHITTTVGKLFERFEQFAIGTAYNKVMARLLFLARNFGETDGNNIIIPIPFTHEDIANSIGITRETASIQIKQLEKEGIIKYKGNFIVVRKSKASKKFDTNFLY